MNRGREKRKASSVNRRELYVNEISDSTDDSDFRIEDHRDDSDNSIESDNNSTSESSVKNENERNNSERANNVKESDPRSKTVHELITMAKNNFKNIELEEIKICCICLDNEHDDSNKIVECVKCKITVHKDCYRILVNKKKIDVLRHREEEWFCDSCKSAVYEPNCELCPNSGGAFKETDNGRWVHLICALYTPDVTFGNRETFSNINMSKINYKKWSEKVCTLCENVQYCRTGICIGCDAGLCRTYFHVTCAQKQGLLVDLHHEDPDGNQPDPFYAHCKLHSDKEYTQRRRRDWIICCSYQKKKQEEIISKPILSKLNKIQYTYRASKTITIHSLSFKTKCPRLLLSSASVCRTLHRKAELKEMCLSSIVENDNNLSTNFDIRRKCAFSSDFVNYFMERNLNMNELKQTLITTIENNKQYIEKHTDFLQNYKQLTDVYSMSIQQNNELRTLTKKYLDFIENLCPNKPLPKIEKYKRYKIQQDFGLETLSNVCDICKEYASQHLLVKCDKCHLYYHLNCLDPPLKRHPRKSRIVGWQCSSCDQTESTNQPGQSISNIGPRATKLKRRLDLENTDDSCDSFSDSSITDTGNSSYVAEEESLEKRPRKLPRSRSQRKF